MRYAIALVLAVLGGVLVPAALLAHDLQDVLLDTDRWVETTAPVLEREDARTALATLVVDETLERASCAGSGSIVGRIGARVGARARPRVIARVEGELAGERAQAAWRESNRAAHATFVRAARSDRIELDERLFDVARLVDVAGAIVGVLGRGGLDDGPAAGASPNACAGGAGLEVLDGDGLRVAGYAARVLDVADWVPEALAALAGMLLLLVVVLARWVGLAAFAGVASLAAFAAGAGSDQLVARLVDDLSSVPTRELADIVLHAALEPLAERQQVLGAVALVTFGASLGLALVRRTRS